MVDVRVPVTFAPLPVPPQNPLRADRVALGERLFFEPVLSRDRSVSCGSCHLPDLAFSDGRTRSVGVEGRTGLRNAPSLLNVAYRRSLFWDGGALFLESQALVPLEDSHEMDLPVDDALDRLRQHPAYPDLFAEAFDGEGPSIQTLTYALAAYQRTLVSAPTAFDRYLAGDHAALAAEARAGLALFQKHCASCHVGAQLTSDSFENNGAAVTDADPGRERITFSDADRGTFRVPSLRAVARGALLPRRPLPDAGGRRGPLRPRRRRHAGPEPARPSAPPRPGRARRPRRLPPHARRRAGPGRALLLIELNP